MIEVLTGYLAASLVDEPQKIGQRQAIGEKRTLNCVTDGQLLLSRADQLI